MLLPALNSAREKARRISCTSNLKQIGLAAKQYSGDFSEKFPCSKDYYQGSDQSWKKVDDGGYHNGPSATLLMSQNYITDYKSFVCPSGTLNGAALAASNVGVTVNAQNYELSTGATASPTNTNFGYAFIAGMNENDSPDSGMIFDCGYEMASKKTNHDKYGNICFVDGSARGEAGDTWTAKINFYGTTGTDFPSMNGGTPFTKKADEAPANNQGKLVQ